MFFSTLEFILNKFKFSNNIYYKYIQICSFIFIILTIFIISDFLLSNITFISYMSPDPNNDPHTKIVQSTIDVLSPVPDKIGKSAAVAATMQNSPAPVKLGMIVAGGAGVLGAKLGMEHLAASVISSSKGNGNSSSSTNQAISPGDNTPTTTAETSSNILENIDSFTNLNELNLLDPIAANNLFILSPNEPNIISLLFTGLDGEVVLSSILILSIVILFFTIILAFMLFILFALNGNINLNFLKNYLSKTTLLYLNNKLEFIAKFLGKSYKLNILLCILLIIIFDCFIIHMVYTILSNLEVFCSNYLENLK